jgi:mannose-1-phosphate guanylyltransferase
MATAMILAAGLGTRLRPLTDELPKPLVPVGDAPLVFQIERHLARSGIERVVMNAHHRAEAFGRLGSPFPLPTSIIEESTILGTAGGVANAREQLPPDDDVLLWNGDIHADIDVGALRTALRQRGAMAAWSVAPRPRGQGTVGVDAAGRVVRVRDFRAGEEARGGDFLGVQWVTPELRGLLPAQGCLVGDAVGPLLARGGLVVAVEHAGPWDDIGTVAAYLRANLRWLSERGLGSLVGPGASAGVSSLDRVVLGAGARVGGAGRVVRCVLWPGAAATAPLSDSIVTTAGAAVRAG